MILPVEVASELPASPKKEHIGRAALRVKTELTTASHQTWIFFPVKAESWSQGQVGETHAPKHGRDLSPPETHSSKRLLKPNCAKNMEIRCLQGDDTYNNQL